MCPSFNLACEDIATRAAIELQADKLVLFSSEQGLLDANGALIRELPAQQAEQHLQRFKTNKQLEPKELLQAAVSARRGGVQRCHIISYHIDGALLTEMFTRDGCGTLVDEGLFQQVREAQIEDVGGLLELIRPLEEQGILVRRSRDLIEREITQFSIVERDGLIIEIGRASCRERV